MKEENFEESKRDVLIAILVLVLIILSLGFFSPSEDKLKKSTADPIDAKEKELKEVDKRIEELVPQKEKLENKEEIIFRAVRTILAFLLLAINFLQYSWIEDWTFQLESHLALNSAIVALYSFVGFSFYGSLEKFREKVRINATNYLRKKHIHIWTELKQLRERKVELEEDIRMLKSIQASSGFSPKTVVKV